MEIVTVEDVTEDVAVESVVVERAEGRSVDVENVTVENVTVENVSGGGVAVENVTVESVGTEGREDAEGRSVDVENVAVENVIVESVMEIVTVEDVTEDVAVESVIVERAEGRSVNVENVTVENVSVRKVAVENVIVESVVTECTEDAEGRSVIVEDVAVENVIVKNVVEVVTVEEVVEDVAVESIGTESVDVGNMTVENVIVESVVTVGEAGTSASTVNGTESFVDGMRMESFVGGTGVSGGGASVLRRKTMTAKEMVRFFQLNQAKVRVKKESVSVKKKETSSRAGAKFTVNTASRLKFKPCDLGYPDSQEKGKQIYKISQDNFPMNQLSENERGLEGSREIDEVGVERSESVVVDKFKPNISGNRRERKLNSEEDRGGHRGNEVLQVLVDTDKAQVESTQQQLSNQETKIADR